MSESEFSNSADIAVIGLAVMGQNLILNMNDHGYKVVAFNRTLSKIDDFLNDQAKDTQVIGAHSVQEMLSLLKRPRKIMLMVKAGDAVDATIEQLLPHLEDGDIVIDGGNSRYSDTIRRTKYLEDKGFLYIGTGVSGGEEGARHGPSIMPGGSSQAWQHVKDIFQDISAKSPNGQPCCDWVGSDGAGHYVKMVHNGIEYGDMQLIAEVYLIMRDYLRLAPGEIGAIFDQWNKTELESYLIEITADILKYKDETGEFLIDKILDTAGQKGTGKWTAIDAAELGQPLTLITEALFARFISALKEARVKTAEALSGPNQKFDGDIHEFVESLRKALYAAKIISYTQGYMLMQAAAKQYNWNLDYGKIAQLWTGGCIIRSKFLSDIQSSYDNVPDLDNLMLAPFFKEALNENQQSFREVVAEAIRSGVAIPALSSGLAFYDSFRTANSQANLLQAQRDYFGAHTYERIDKPRGEFFHTNWTGEGGSTSSSTYNA